MAGADVGVEPWGGGERLVAAEVHAAERGGEAVFAGAKLVEDVKQVGEVLEDPGLEAVLVGDVAHALLAVLTADEHTDRPAPADMIELTCAEIRRLLITLIVEPARALACPLRWSHWRRRHQHRARTSHYQRQQTSEPSP